MIKYENDCVCCDIPCIDCGRKHALHYYCDKCEEEYFPEELADYDGQMLCMDCLFKEFPHFTGDDNA